MPVAKKRVSTKKIAAEKEMDFPQPEMNNYSMPQEKAKNYTPILMGALIIGAFFLGGLVDRVMYLSKGTATTQMAPSQQAQGQPSATVTPLHVAKQIGMDPDKFKQCLESGKYTKQVAQDLADGQKAGVQGTPAAFVNGQLLVGAQPFSAFKTVIDQELANPNAPLPTGTRVSVDPGTLPAMGDANAPVTLIEFADFQCPFCQRFFTDTEKQIISDYVKTGKVKFIFRNYAFLGPDSNTTAEGAYCATEQNKFWEYHDFLYTHQGQENSGQFSKANIE